MATFSNADLANFSGLVAKVWNDDDLRQRYEAEPKAVLAEHGITLPEGVPLPLIPPSPADATDGSSIGALFSQLPFENWDLTVRQLPEPADGHGPVAISVGCLATGACPVSCFSSLSN